MRDPMGDMLSCMSDKEIQKWVDRQNKVASEHFQLATKMFKDMFRALEELEKRHRERTSRDN